MSLWFTICTALGATAALVSVAVSFAYPFACKALEKHISTPRPDFREEEAASKLWMERRWALDKYRVRVALVGMVAYAFGMLALTSVINSLHGDGQSHPYYFGLLMFVTASILTIGLRSTIHNSRCSDIDMRRQYPSLYPELHK